MTTEAVLKKYILTECMFEEDESLLSSDEQLLEKGILDSMKLIQLVQFVEEHFNVSIDDEDLSPDNFQTINHVTELIARKQQGQQ